MYVGLMFAISTFSLDSFTFELSIGDSSARHSAAPTKQSVNQRSCFCFHESCFEIGSAFPVDISFRTPRNALDCKCASRGGKRFVAAGHKLAGFSKWNQ